MHNRFLALQSIVLLVLAAVTPVAAAASSQRECSRDISRRVRSFVHVRLLQSLGVPPESLPESCPLHPASDMFWDQEQHKVKTTNDQWRCSYCSKMFRNEHYLDKHMQLKHPDKVNADGQCLADLCPIFGCQAMFKDEKADTMRAKFDNTVSCVEDDAEAFRFRCENIAKRCFVPNSKIDNVFRNRICNAIRCERGLLQGPHIDVNTPSPPDSVSRALYNLFVIVAVLATVGVAAWSAWKWRSRSGHTVLRTQAQRTSALDRVVDVVSSLVGGSKASKKRR